MKKGYLVLSDGKYFEGVRIGADKETVGELVFTTGMEGYLETLTPETPEDEALCATIRQQNILIVDDVTTSGSTLNEILRTLRILNEDNQITIFSLIGRKDLMAETV